MKPWTGTDFPHDGVALRVFRKHKVKHKLAVLETDEIDQTASRDNQVRIFSGLKSNVIERYRAMIRNGETAPALTVYYDRKKQKYVVIDGLHRLFSGVEEGLKTYTVYIVQTTDPGLINVLKRTFNAGHGEPFSEEQAIEHASSLVKENGWTIQSAAEEYGVAATTVGRHIRAEEVKSRLARLSRSGAVVSEEWLLDRLGSIRLDNVFVVAFDAVVEVMTKRQAKADDINAMIVEVNKKTSEAEAIQYIEDWLAGRATVPAPPPFLSRLIRLVETAEKASDWGKLKILGDEQRQLTSDYCDRLREEIDRLQQQAEDAGVGGEPVDDGFGPEDASPPPLLEG